jgi:hypothetical protein
LLLIIIEPAAALVVARPVMLVLVLAAPWVLNAEEAVVSALFPARSLMVVVAAIVLLVALFRRLVVRVNVFLSVESRTAFVMVAFELSPPRVNPVGTTVVESIASLNRPTILYLLGEVGVPVIFGCFRSMIRSPEVEVAPMDVKLSRLAWTVPVMTVLLVAQSELPLRVAVTTVLPPAGMSIVPIPPEVLFTDASVPVAVQVIPVVATVPLGTLTFTTELPVAVTVAVNVLTVFQAASALAASPVYLGALPITTLVMLGLAGLIGTAVEVAGPSIAPRALVKFLPDGFWKAISLPV